jgi:RNA polymerase sigma factor (sigma-70 family)
VVKKTMKIEAEIKLRNANLRQRRLELGMTQKQVAEKCGVSVASISHIENLYITGTDELLKKIANVLNLEVEDIKIKWPKDVPTSDSCTADINPDQLEAYRIIQRNRALEMAKNPMEILMDKENSVRNERLMDVLNDLSFREREIIKMRYGIGSEKWQTLREIGKKFNLCKARIREIEARALRKLQHPSFSNRIVEIIH